MSYNKPIRRIAIVGTGVIGASWAAEYLARGFDVIATDPEPSAEANLRKYVDAAWKDLTNIGLSKGASRDRLTFTKDLKEALSKADFVQENGPERPDFKMKLFADMDDAAPIDSIIASSSSGITPSVMQSKSKHPERILVGHPFNPPHIIPLVEVVGGTKTSPEAIQQALAFYASIGKKPIHLKKELPGHVGNRLHGAQEGGREREEVAVRRRLHGRVQRSARCDARDVSQHRGCAWARRDQDGVAPGDVREQPG